MEICVNNSLKIVEIWLTRAEQDEKTYQLIQPLYEKYKKYKVAIFESGHGDLLDFTTGLLIHNRKGTPNAS